METERAPESAATSGVTDIARVLSQAHAAWIAGERAAAISMLSEFARGDSTAGTIWSRLGAYSLEAGDNVAAEAALRRATAIMPRDPVSLANLGTALLRLRRPDEAISTYNAVLAIDPAAIGARLNLGNAYMQRGDLDAAVAELEDLRDHAPESADNLNNLGNLYKEQGRIDEAFAAYERARTLDGDFRPAFSNLLALTKLSTRHSPTEVSALHRAFAERFEHEWQADYVPPRNEPDVERRLRVGYVSPDCHTALPAFVEPVLRAHDRRRFELFAYFNNAQPAATLARLAPIEARVMKGASDAEVAEWVRRDGIDILIDIAGHTGHNRLGVFGRKPAPVQITWLDYLNTTGLDAIGYRLTDAISDPPGASEALHSETLLRLAPTQWCWSPPSSRNAPSPLPARAAGFVTLGSFNNYSKLTDATLALWARVLAGLPAARLLVVGVPRGYARARVTKALGERVKCLERLSPEAYRAAMAGVDIALDPMPFSGATTTLEALWQGVPVVTHPCASNVSRSTASLLSALSLEEWIARSDDDYIDIVTRAAADLPRLAALRAELRARVAQSPVCDATRFTRTLENLLEAAWRAWCSPATAATPRIARRRRLDTQLAAVETAIGEGKHAQAATAASSILDETPSWAMAQRAYLRALHAWSDTQPGLVDRMFPPVPTPARPPRVSAVICSIDPARFRRVVASFTTRFAGYPLEIVGIHDARSLPEGYNRGAAKAGGDILVFCHDDIEIVTPDFAPRLIGHLDQHDGIGVAGASNALGPRWDDAGQRYIHGHILHPAPPQRAGVLLMVSGFQAPVCTKMCLLDGVFIAVRRNIWESVGFDADRYDGFHLYDLDFTWRASRGGASLAVACDLTLFHASKGRYNDAWRRYARRFIEAAGLDPWAAPRPGGLQTRLETIEQVNRLRAAMLHFRYGAPTPT